MQPRCVVVLSTKSAGSSALQRLLCQFGGGRHVEHSRHSGRDTVETLYWTKAASVLGLPQVKLPDSEVPIPASRAERDLRTLLAQNVPGFEAPGALEPLIFDGWRALCRRHAPLFVEKSPHHLHQWSVLELLARALERMPDIDFRFVGLVRNPMDVLYSAWRRWRTRPEVLQHHWRVAYDNLRRWQPVAGERLLCLRYEDFSSDPGTAARLMRFLDLPAPAGIEHFIHGASRQRWKTDPWFRFRLDPEVAAAAQLWGYRPEELDNEPNRLWLPYSLMARLGHRTFRVPQQKARRTYRKLRHTLGTAT